MGTDRPVHDHLPESTKGSLHRLQPDCAAVAETVKSQDLDAWLAGLLVPETLQMRHWAVWGLVTDVLALPWKVSEPTLGLIRLQWWLDELAAEAPVQHPLNRLVHAAVKGAPDLQTDLIAFVEATADWLAEPLNEEGAERWLAAVEELASAIVLAAMEDEREQPESTKAWLKAVGRTWGCATLLRRAPHVRRNGLPLLRDRDVARHVLNEGRNALLKARRNRPVGVKLRHGQKALLRAFSLAPLWLKAAEKGFQADAEQGGKAVMPPYAPPSQAARQWRLLLMRLTGRIV